MEFCLLQHPVLLSPVLKRESRLHQLPKLSFSAEHTKPRIHQVDRRNFAFHARRFFCTARHWEDPIVFLDTEFPGTPYRSRKLHYLLTPAERYALLKQNVDSLSLIQVGITLYNHANKASITWQFDVCDFDARFHLQAPDSIALLKSSGIDLECTRQLGVPSTWIAQLLFDSGLMGYGCRAIWVTFQGCHDFAFLLKACRQRVYSPWHGNKALELPNTLPEFMKLVRFFFGSSLYDVKNLMKSCGGLTGGLDRVGAQLNVSRTAGVAHHAGSDSLLTCGVFLELQKLYFNGCVDQGDMIRLPYQGELFGLEEEQVHAHCS